MPTVTITTPANDTLVQAGASFNVSGRVSDVRPILKITVAVAGQSPINASFSSTSNASHKTQIFAYAATVAVPALNDFYVLTVVAHNDLDHVGSATVTVLTRPPLRVQPPALLADVRADPLASFGADAIPTLTSAIQRQLVPLALKVANIGLILAGPNFMRVVVDGVPILRMGIWLVDPAFPLENPNPQLYPLPLVAAANAAREFAVAPFLPLPSTVGTEIYSFGYLLLTNTLQSIVNANFSDLKDSLSKMSSGVVNLESIIVACTTGPDGVVTTLRANGLGAEAGATLSEFIGITPVINTSPLQSVPAVTSSSISSTFDPAIQAEVAILIPPVVLVSSVIAILVPRAISSLSGAVTALAATEIALIPASLAIPAFQGGPTFPAVTANWTKFGTTASGMLGLGKILITARTQPMVGLTMTGPERLEGIAQDFSFGAEATYNLNWHGIAPDPDKFTWEIKQLNAVVDTGGVPFSPYGTTTSLLVAFPLPALVSAGVHSFALRVTAIETTVIDLNSALTASASLEVKVHVRPSPQIPIKIP